MSDKIVDVYADWDDPHAFRVFLGRETGEDGEIEYKPMRAVHFGDDTDVRIYRAAFVACPKDIADQEVRQEALGWPKEAPAQRVAKAVKKELARIERGEPGPSDAAIQFALATLPRRKRRPEA